MTFGLKLTPNLNEFKIMKKINSLNETKSVVLFLVSVLALAGCDKKDLVPQSGTKPENKNNVSVANYTEASIKYQIYDYDASAPGIAKLIPTKYDWGYIKKDASGNLTEKAERFHMNYEFFKDSERTSDQYKYNAKGQVIENIHNNAEKTEYTYNTSGKLTQQVKSQFPTQKLLEKKEYKYNDEGHKIQESIFTDPYRWETPQSIIEYKYNNKGNVTSESTSKIDRYSTSDYSIDQIVEYEYTGDSLALETFKEYSQLSRNFEVFGKVVYTYSGGNVKKVSRNLTDGNTFAGEETYTYDEKKRIKIKEVIFPPNTISSYKITFTYDDFGRIKEEQVQFNPSFQTSKYLLPAQRNTLIDWMVKIYEYK